MVAWMRRMDTTTNEEQRMVDGDGVRAGWIPQRMKNSEWSTAMVCAPDGYHNE
jgi:hypothetical protein